MISKEKTQMKVGWLHLINAVLSIYVLIALLIDTLYKLPPEEHDLLLMIDHGICVFFLVEFCRDFYRAENKWKFMRWGWIDLLSSLPYLEIFREGRLIRIVRIIRIIRAFKNVSELLNHLFENRMKGTFGSALIFAILTWIFSAIAILAVEHAPESNIKTAEDALWWAYVTITTVGYGDKYPVTTEGRLIAGVLMTTGVGLFGMFTGYLASFFVQKEVAQELADSSKEKASNPEEEA
ncbi:MAG: potassium channel family protein [Chitinophagaceae bacterium]